MVLCTWGEAAIVWYGTYNGYSHNNLVVQQKIDQSKARHALVRGRGGKYIHLLFRSMVLGKEVWERMKNTNNKEEKTVDWTVVKKVLSVHRLLLRETDQDMNCVVKTLQTTLKEMNEEHMSQMHSTSKRIIQAMEVNSTGKGNDCIVVAGMIKALVGMYKDLSIMEVELTESRCNELQIPLRMTNQCEGRNVYSVKLDVIFGNKYGSIDALTKTYKTQNKTSGTLPSGVPTGQGQL